MTRSAAINKERREERKTTVKLVSRFKKMMNKQADRLEKAVAGDQE